MTASWESQIALLNSEWRTILAIEQARSASEVEEWETRIVDLRAEQDVLLREGLWVSGPDDILSILQRARSEVCHSAMLAWLLDPQGRHGLGAALLKALLRCCSQERPLAALHLARPALEVSRGDTRADIVVTGPGLSLVIENKVDAGEQPRQCDRLYERFGREPGAVFIFLSPSGRAPETATGSAREAFTPVRYSDLVELLRESLSGAPGRGATARA